MTSAFRNPRYECHNKLLKEKVLSVDPACPGNLSVLLPWWAEMVEISSVVVVSQVKWAFGLCGVLMVVFW